MIKASDNVQDIPMNTQYESHSHSQALRLDKVASQLEVDSSDSDTEDFGNPIPHHRPPTNKYRAESESPERYTGSSEFLGRDTF